MSQQNSLLPSDGRRGSGVPFQVNSEGTFEEYRAFPKLYDEQVRINIFEHLLVSEDPLELAAPDEYTPGHYWWHYTSLLPALGALRLSKTIHAEPAETYYGKNEFRFSGPAGWLVLDAFLAAIGPRNRQYLRHITVHAGFVRDVVPGAPAPFVHPVAAALFAPATLTDDAVRNRGVLVRRGLPVPAYWTRAGANPSAAALTRSAVARASAALIQAAAANAAHGGARALRALDLVLPYRAEVAGPWDFEGMELACHPESCEDRSPEHMRMWHGDRFYWAVLLRLRAAVGGLRVRLVLQHEEDRENVARNRYVQYLFGKVWMINQAMDRGFEMAHSTSYNPWYEVEEEGDALMGFLPGWRMPNV